jgi:hypothetical protein
LPPDRSHAVSRNQKARPRWPGFFFCAIGEDYRATRNFASEVPIALKAVTARLAEYSGWKFSISTGAVGSGGLPVFGGERQRPLSGRWCYFCQIRQDRLT